jgi:hypothetical protein
MPVAKYSSCRTVDPKELAGKKLGFQGLMDSNGQSPVEPGHGAQAASFSRICCSISSV